MGAWHQDGLADWLSVVMWLWLWLWLWSDQWRGGRRRCNWQRRWVSVKRMVFEFWAGLECRQYLNINVLNTLFLYDHFGTELAWKVGARISVLNKALCYKPEGRGLHTPWGEWIVSIYLILPASLGPGIYSASNRNSTRSRKVMLLGSRALPVQPVRHLWADCLDNVGSLTPHNPVGLHGLLRG
jgi:hypothetical protein